MIKGSLDRISISVRDMEESLGFFRDTIQMRVIADEQLETAQLCRLWNLPAGSEARLVLLDTKDQAALLELIEFKPNSGQFMRSGAKTYDYGIFDVAFRTKDLDASYERLKAEGYRFFSPPVTYTADWVNVTVKEAIMIGPNEMPVALIERISEPIPEIEGDFGPMIDAAQFVKEMDLVTQFYTDILGLTKVFDQQLPSGLIEEVVDLPRDSTARMAFVVKPGVDAPLLEFIHCSAEGRSLAEIAKPPNIGIFSLAFQTEQLDALKQKIEGTGFRTLSGPVELTVGSHQSRRVITIEGPNGSMLEFFEL